MVDRCRNAILKESSARSAIRLRGGSDPEEEIKRVLQANKYENSMPLIWLDLFCNKEHVRRRWLALVSLLTNEIFRSESFPRVSFVGSDLENKVADLAKSYEKLAANYGLGSFKPSRTASYSNLNEEMLTGWVHLKT